MSLWYPKNRFFIESDQRLETQKQRLNILDILLNFSYSRVLPRTSLCSNFNKYHPHLNTCLICHILVKQETVRITDRLRPDNADNLTVFLLNAAHMLCCREPGKSWQNMLLNI
jgi:hypothetical protein